ncbi:hypothetical protein FRACYDRAFT_179950 [Fragilariopsis cylindrus CCMP1102]|uniref:histidine kinase n=1 Tax=Fragilariopsis cylindrus CCMP1102 TaxID=635003 RepID=A0A1E7FTQ5_9STRA|nr:hypothetical protein FRACYDRAFT_179950 [Fragilariopsis cylindrus CCMP1102]|eukprot:OEU21529.1 hypothetical protein FRACYDRAFT_179950 [Fragilariopsis cylindrus CCMP1102]
MESEIDDRTTELETANRKLEEANAEISRHASKQLEHFACMSHEIRTPLNCIVGLSSLLLENDDLDEELIDTVNMVYNSADLVQGVVNDVLDYAKIESGHFELDIKPSDLQSALNGVVHSISNKLQDKNVEVRTSYDGLLQKMMTTDSRRLQQILYNILGNAAKFNNGYKNTSTFTTACANKIQFSIKDHGKGIDENDFEKIFQPFSQASKETQTVYGGTGLGLSITKNLVSRLGGTISIKSEIEKFTEFIVELPYNEELFDTTVYKEKALETAISKIYPPRALKILVAEDNIINQKVIDRILKHLGVTDITIVDDGKKAVDASFITNYDCILMDMQMPIMDGLEACRQIVKRDGKENANVIFVTAHALVEFKEKALNAGGIDFVTKPFKMEAIDKLLVKLEETLL